MLGVPELPDIELYLHALRPRVAGRLLEQVTIRSPFVLRSFEPPTEAIENRTVQTITRLGKRLVFEFDVDLFLVIHLMIAGRFRWSDKPDAKLPGKIGLASFRFDSGALHLVESAKQRQASIHIARSLPEFTRGGTDVRNLSAEQFHALLSSSGKTVKRALTMPTLFDGIGNAYSDEILHAARLSPFKRTSDLEKDAADRLHNAACDILNSWTAKLIAEFGNRFPGPGDVTAFRPDFAVHGKFGLPCPTCGTAVQRIRYSGNETNYCPTCQTGGRILADRSLSRLLKDDWPRTVEQLED